MHTGRGGMGSHKHGISGHATRSPRYKHGQQIEANKGKPARKIRPRDMKRAQTVAELLKE